jgi:hypothetical protein
MNKTVSPNSLKLADKLEELARSFLKGKWDFLYVWTSDELEVLRTP